MKISTISTMIDGRRREDDRSLETRMRESSLKMTRMRTTESAREPRAKEGAFVGADDDDTTTI